MEAGPVKVELAGRMKTGRKGKPLRLPWQSFMPWLD